MTPPSNSKPTAAGFTRLHITPLDPELLSVVVPSSVLPRAQNISYHTLEAFPERRYGYVDLPIADAEKVKKRLNGSVLKGEKMRVEKARPEAIPAPTGADETSDKPKKEKKSKKKDSSKKRKREQDVIPGVELEGRKIRRGWTTSEQEMIQEKRKEKAKKDKKPETDKKSKKKEKKRENKSKYTDDPECLFKTKLPSATPAPQDDADTTAPPDRKKKKRRHDNSVIVHEFENATKFPSFLKSTASTAQSEAVTFEDGVGWLDGSGNVVEKVVTTRPSANSTKKKSAPSKKVEATPEAIDEADTTSSAGTSSSDEDSDSDDASNTTSEDDEEDPEEVDEAQDANPAVAVTANTQEMDFAAPAKNLKLDTAVPSSPGTAPKSESSRPKSSGSMTSLTIKIPPSTPAASKIHPLEALYKRTNGETETPNAGGGFTFFGNDDDLEDEDGGEGKLRPPPMTPFTKQDFDFRNVRSAAPTPDTAHPARAYNFWANMQDTVDEDPDAEDEQEIDMADGVNGDASMPDAAEDEDDEDQEEAEDESSGATKPQGAPVSDFQKQFWENRGELNRKWRKRKKAASKEKRYRENRSRAERAI